MKAIFCGACGTLNGMPPSGEPTTCECGLISGRWYDGKRGLALFAGDYPVCWGIGISNYALLGQYDDWKRADGTLFKRFQTNVVRFKPGTTPDTRFVSREVFDAREWPADESG